MKRIRRGTLIWQYVVGESVLEHDEASMRSRLCDLSKQAAADLLEHVYVWEGAVIEILDDAKVWNTQLSRIQATIQTRRSAQATA